MSKRTIEVNFDGLIGPTHNFAGLSAGNLASQKNRFRLSNPRRAALQGLEKMSVVADLGVTQAVIPPQERPDFSLLGKAGIRGRTPTQVLVRAQRQRPRLLATSYSASNMWVANAATVSPGPDTADHRIHLTPANLVAQLHRSIEAPHTAACFRKLFDDDEVFVHHEVLPASLATGALCSDEGAANHSRLCAYHGAPGVELFVYGRADSDSGAQQRRFLARHTLEASRAVARQHGLRPQRTVFARQKARAIDAGVFHNDLVAVGNESVFIYHEHAFDQPAVAIEEMRAQYRTLTDSDPTLIEIRDDELSLEAAVQTYLFNSQIVTVADGSMAWIAPRECESHSAARSCLNDLLDRVDPIRSVHFIDLSESMKNGGGPACLRLRIVLTARELAAVHQGVLLTEQLRATLGEWIQRSYRDRLHGDDLADPELLAESYRALDELTAILGLGSDFYPFQRLGAPATR